MAFINAFLYMFMTVLSPIVFRFHLVYIDLDKIFIYPSINHHRKIEILIPFRLKISKSLPRFRTRKSNLGDDCMELEMKIRNSWEAWFNVGMFYLKTCL